MLYCAALHWTALDSSGSRTRWAAMIMRRGGRSDRRARLPLQYVRSASDDGRQTLGRRSA